MIWVQREVALGARARGFHIVTGEVLEALPELGGFSAELLVGQGLDRRLEGIDLSHDRAQTFQFTIVLGTDDFGEKGIEHEG